MTRPRLRVRPGQAGLTLIEMLIAASLMIVLILGIFGTFDGFSSVQSRVVTQNEAESAVRNGINQIVRLLRNIAGQGTNPQLVERAQGNDMIFQSIDPIGPNGGLNPANVRRLRFCLDTSNAASETLWMGIQTWTTASPPAMPTATACPGSGWPTTRVLATNVTNMRDGLSRPLFTYDSATLSAITRIGVLVWVDPTPGTGAAERSLTSGVYLRNQNRAPSASFTATAIANHHVILNGSASSDPDGQYLAYDWYADGAFVGRGTVLDYAAPGPGTVSFTLTVTDTGGLTASAPAQGVSIP